MLKTRIKAAIVMLITVFSIVLLYESPLIAAEPSQSSDKDDQTTLLSKITDNTYWLWFLFNEFSMAWLNPDDKDSTATLQEDLTNYMNYTWQNQTAQLNLQTNLLTTISHFFPDPLPPNIDDLSYTSVLGSPISGNTSNLQNNIQNYVINTAALNIKHVPPGSAGWFGSEVAKTNYKNFYNTITAVQTFNAYVLSDYIVNYQNGPLALSQLQENLKDEASSPDWFTQIASENIGLVLRQILLFESQTYLLMLQMVETQKQQLAVSAMSNSLVVLGNQFNESQLLNKAQGTPPS